MIYFVEELKNIALELLEQKSLKDDIKAEKDLLDINNMLQFARPTSEFIKNARTLHIRINDEYPLIQKMHETAQKMLRASKGQGMNYMHEYEEIKSILKGDMYGVLATVLINHKKISDVKDFIERVE